MPESKVRRKAASKRSATNSAKEAQRRANNNRRMAMTTRDWVPYVFVPLAVVGVIWLVVFYIAGGMIPFMASLGNWNFLIGLGLIAASFGVATMWK